MTTTYIVADANEIKKVAREEFDRYVAANDGNTDFVNVTLPNGDAHHYLGTQGHSVTARTTLPGFLEVHTNDRDPYRVYGIGGWAYFDSRPMPAARKRQGGVIL